MLFLIPLLLIMAPFTTLAKDYPKFEAMGGFQQIISICLCEKTLILQAFAHDSLEMKNNSVPSQLPLFNF
jgi:hypothetical protein